MFSLIYRWVIQIFSGVHSKINNASVFLLTANKKFVFGDMDVCHHLKTKWLQFRMEKMKRSTILCLWEFLTAAQHDFQIVRDDGWNIFCWAAQKL